MTFMDSPFSLFYKEMDNFILILSNSLRWVSGIQFLTITTEMPILLTKNAIFRTENPKILTEIAIIRTNTHKIPTDILLTIYPSLIMAFFLFCVKLLDTRNSLSKKEGCYYGEKFESLCTIYTDV